MLGYPIYVNSVMSNYRALSIVDEYFINRKQFEFKLINDKHRIYKKLIPETIVKMKEDGTLSTRGSVICRGTTNHIILKFYCFRFHNSKYRDHFRIEKSDINDWLTNYPDHVLLFANVNMVYDDKEEKILNLKKSKLLSLVAVTPNVFLNSDKKYWRDQSLTESYVRFYTRAKGTWLYTKNQKSLIENDVYDNFMFGIKKINEEKILTDDRKFTDELYEINKYLTIANHKHKLKKNKKYREEYLINEKTIFM